MKWMPTVALAAAIATTAVWTGAALAKAPAPAKGGGNASPTKVDAKKLKTTKSGLKYAILKPGTGAVAKPGQQVTVHYTGWLKSNGKKFDSSVDRGEPFPFTLGAGMVIPGWDEGVAGMKVGEKRQLQIPFKLAYGTGGRPPVIPPSSDLIFDVELIGVK